MSRAFVAVLLAGCTGGTASLPSPSPYAGCLLPPDTQTTTATGAPIAASVTGEVTGSGTGDDAGCFDQLSFRSSSELDVDGSWWVEIDGWHVGVWLPDGPAAPEVGVTVALDASYYFGGFTPVIGWVDLQDTDGNGLAFVGVGGELADLPTPPGPPLKAGPEAAHDHDSCGSWTSYDLDAGTTTIPYGGQDVVDGVEIRHGGIDLQDGSGSCPDWFVAHAAVAVSPG